MPTATSPAHAFQEAFAGADQDRETTLSALASLRGRVQADAVLIASLDKELLFDTRRPQLHSVPFPFPKLIDKAETSDGTYAFVVLDRELYAIAIAPLLAPDPIAWLCPMFRVDDDSGYDPRKRPFYERARSAGRMVWSPPYIFYDQGVPGVTCANPV